MIINFFKSHRLLNKINIIITKTKGFPSTGTCSRVWRAGQANSRGAQQAAPCSSSLRTPRPRWFQCPARAGDASGTNWCACRPPQPHLQWLLAVIFREPRATLPVASSLSRARTPLKREAPIFKQTILTAHQQLAPGPRPASRAAWQPTCNYSTIVTIICSQIEFITANRWSPTSSSKG